MITTTIKCEIYLFVFTFAFLLFQLPVYAQTCSPAQIGLVSWWSGDGNALDWRSRNNGTLQNGASFAAGRVGQAFNLDGVDDAVQIPHSANQNINGSFTAEAWIFPRTIQNNSPRIFDKTGGTAYVFAIDQTQQLDASINSVFIQSPIGSVPLNQWTYAVFTYNGTTGELKIYINGVFSVSTIGPIQTTSSTAPLFIGNQSTNVRQFDGLIDEPAIYNRELSASEIQAIFNAGTAGKCKPTATVSPSGQVGWWSGDGNANDIAGTNNGTLTNGAGFAIGKVGQSFNFDGVDDSVQVSTTAINFGTGDFTIDLWFNQNSTSAAGSSLFGKTVGIFPNDQTYLLETSNGNLLRFLVRGTTANENDLNITVSLPTSTWHHVVAVRQDNINRLYLNGLQIGQQTAGSNVNTGAGGEAFIGRLPEIPTRFFDGRIDETSLYNRALTDAEITSIFNAGIAGKLKDNPTPTGSNVAVNTKSDGTVTFATVSTAGITQQIPLDLSLFPSLPPGFTATGLAADIVTSAIFSGSPRVCFNLPSVTNPTIFSNLRILHLESNLWVNRTHLASINFATRTICTNSGLPSLSPFAIVNGFAPTAAESSISGQVTTAIGRGIRNVVVQISGGNLGETRYVRTNPFGYYRISGLDSGQTYILNVASKQYSFANPTRVITLNEDLTGENFVSESK
jgi:hypothetical protein